MDDHDRLNFVMAEPAEAIEEAEASVDVDGAERYLSVERTEKVIQFQEITGLSDLHACRLLLERRNWCLEDAVQEHLGFGDVFSEPDDDGFVFGPRLRCPRVPLAERSNLSSTLSSGAQPAPPLPLRPSQYPIQQEGDGNGAGFAPLSLLAIVVGLFVVARRVIRYVMSLPLSLAHSAVSTVLGVMTQIFNALFFEPIAHRRSDPRDDVAAFIELFRRKYAPQEGEMPPFVQLGYRQALDQAKRDLTFLVVYLHSEEHRDTKRFCSESLCHPDVLAFLRNESALLYGCLVSSGDGYSVSQIMRGCTYPFVAIVCLKNNQMTIVERMEGALPADRFLAFLRNGIQGNEIHLTAARLLREEWNAARELRAQQDLAYEESLECDRQRQREQQALRDAEKREEERRALIQKQKVDFVSRIPPEPMVGTASVFTLNVMLPDGSRLIRRFLSENKLSAESIFSSLSTMNEFLVAADLRCQKKDDDLVSCDYLCAYQMFSRIQEDLFYFVFCGENSPDEFDLVTSYPKRTIPCRPLEVPLHAREEPDVGQDTGLTFQQFQLTSSQVVRVIDLEA